MFELCLTNSFFHNHLNETFSERKVMICYEKIQLTALSLIHMVNIKYYNYLNQTF